LPAFEFGCWLDMMIIRTEGEISKTRTFDGSDIEISAEKEPKPGGTLVCRRRGFEAIVARARILRYILMSLLRFCFSYKKGKEKLIFMVATCDTSADQNKRHY
jgi:hypothetical protein